KVAISQRVVQVPPVFRGVQRGRACQRHHGHVLSARAGNAVYSRQLTHAIGGQQCAHPRLPAIAISSIGGVELITSSHKFNVVGLIDLLNKAQIEITRHADDVLDAQFFQPVDNKFAHGSAHCSYLHEIEKYALNASLLSLCFTSLSKSLDKTGEFLRQMSKYATIKCMEPSPMEQPHSAQPRAAQLGQIQSLVDELASVLQRSVQV